MNFHLHPSFNPTRTSIVTPKFWGGYFLPAENAELTARYYPAINQVWINSNLTEIDIEFAHIHECLHCFTSCFQPAQLLALQAELTGKIRIPTSKQFEDFVETACLAYLLVTAKLDVSPQYIVGGKPVHRKMTADLITLAHNIYRSSSKKLEPKDGVREALGGLCHLLMHVVPYQDNLGSKFIDMIYNQPLPVEWESQWQVFRHYFEVIYKKWQESETIKQQFCLALPMDLHRDILDMIIFFANAIESVEKRPLAITIVFPTLLMIFSLRSFRLLPVIFVNPKGNHLQARIEVDHVTQRSLKDINWAVSKQQDSLSEWQQKNKNCGAASVFLDIAENTKPFIISNSKDRAFNCFQTMLIKIPQFLEKYLEQKNLCPDCNCIVNKPIFSWARQIIKDKLPKNKASFLEAAQCYTHWLTSDSPALMADTLKLSCIPEVVRKFHYL